MPRVMLIRHAHPVVDPEVPAAQWPLSEEGRGAAYVLARRIDAGTSPTIATSDETKAIETSDVVADVTGGVVVVDERLREVSRPWVPEGYERLASAWLVGRHLDGWESQETASRRMSRAITDVLASTSATLVVTHGLVMTAFLAASIGVDPVPFWEDLRLPDAWWVDPEDRRLERLAG